MNEILGLLIIQENIPESGLEELSFYHWPSLKEGTLDDSVLQQYVNKCHSLKKLKIDSMLDCSESIRMQLARFASSIFATST